MQAIETKYLPTTNFKGSRIKASCERGSVTVSYPHEVGWGEDAHRVAIEALLSKFEAEDIANWQKREATEGRDSKALPPDSLRWWAGSGYVMGGTKIGYVAVGIYPFNHYGKSEASK